MRTHKQYKWLFASSSRYYYTQPPTLRLSRTERWKQIAKLLKLSPTALLHLEWIIYYSTTARQDVSLTARHFGISRKTLHKWLNRFDPDRLQSLEVCSTTPKRTRTRQYTPLQYERIVRLRKQYLRYGKMKLLQLYRSAYPTDTTISSWKIQCIIMTAGIYYHPQRQARINRKRVRSVQRKRITELKRQPVSGFLLCMDTVVRYWHGQKRYIVTGIEVYPIY